MILSTLKKSLVQRTVETFHRVKAQEARLSLYFSKTLRVSSTFQVYNYKMTRSLVTSLIYWEDTHGNITEALV